MKNHKEMETQVVIIGAGIMGLSTAYYLAKQGMKACVLEQMPYAGGYTTSRCAGGFRSQFNTRLNIELSLYNQLLMERMEKDDGINLQINRCGYYFLANQDKDVSILQKSAYLQNSMGVGTRLLYGREIQTELPYLNCSGTILAAVCKNDGLFDVASMTSHLAGQLKKLGVPVLKNMKVTGIDRMSGRIAGVQTSQGEICAPHVVIAAGPWSQGLAKMVDIDLPLAKVPQQLFLTTGVNWAESIPVVVYLHNGLGFHAQSGAILSGMTKEKANSAGEGLDHDWTFEHCFEAVRYLPELIHTSIACEWWGYYDSTPDAKPIIGKLPVPGLFCLAGFDGHGLMHGLAAGNIVSSMIARGKFEEFDVAGASIERFLHNADIKKKNEIRI